MATLVGKVQMITNIGFLVFWTLLMFKAYGGQRFIGIPFIHRMAVRLARKTQRRRELRELHKKSCSA